MNERQSWNIILIFLLLIFGFSAATLVLPKHAFSETENRTLAQLPDADADTIFSGSFEEDYETYLTDQFPGRDAWIGLKTKAERLMLRQDTNDVYFAKDDYLIEKHTGVFETEQAAQNIRYVADFFASLTDRYPIEALSVMVVPNAVDVLSDLLPPFAAPFDEDIYLEALSGAMPEGVWFDSAAALKAHDEEEIFYRTDHHWTTLGAYYTFAAWAKQQGGFVPEVSDYDEEIASRTFEGTIAAKVGGAARPDMIRIFHDSSQNGCMVLYPLSGTQSDTLYQSQALDTRDQYSVFLGGNNAIIRIRTAAGTGRKLLLIKDSYTHCFAPFLTGMFDQIDLLDLRYYANPVSDLMREQQYTDVMLLMNVAGFAEDTSLIRLTG